MVFFEELHCKWCLLPNEAKYDSCDVREHFNIVFASRDSCHNCQN